MHPYDIILGCIAIAAAMMFVGMVAMPAALPISGITGILLVLMALFVMPSTELNRKI